MNKKTDEPGKKPSAQPSKVTCYWSCVDVVHRGSSSEARFQAVPSDQDPKTDEAHVTGEAYGQMGLVVTNPELFQCFEPGKVYVMEIKEKK